MLTPANRLRAIRALGSLVTRLADPHADGSLIIADLQAVLAALNIRTLNTDENMCGAARRAWPEQG